MDACKLVNLQSFPKLAISYFLLHPAFETDSESSRLLRTCSGRQGDL